MKEVKEHKLNELIYNKENQYIYFISIVSIQINFNKMDKSTHSNARPASGSRDKND